MTTNKTFNAEEGPMTDRSRSEGSAEGAAAQVAALEDQASRLQRRANDFVHQRPLLALTMAVAGGYLAGRVLSRV